MFRYPIVDCPLVLYISWAIRILERPRPKLSICNPIMMFSICLGGGGGYFVTKWLVFTNSNAYTRSVWFTYNARSLGHFGFGKSTYPYVCFDYESNKILENMGFLCFLYSYKPYKNCLYFPKISLDL